ncbi:MAG TPA: hypothetical protein VEB19_18390 [Gemmatimonadaceae bacterium]|nr:hypothetical protein [Gemmatimonadaceae bacterium]
MTQPLPDDISDNPHQPELAGPAPVLQWAGMFLSPAALLLHLQVNYLLVLYICGTTIGRGPVYAAGFIALLLSAVGCLAAWLTWTRAGQGPPGNDSGALPRTRMLGVVGLGVSGITFLVLVAQVIAAFVGVTCG